GRGAGTSGWAQATPNAGPLRHPGDGRGAERAGRAQAAPEAGPQKNQGDGQGESRPEEGFAEAGNNRVTTAATLSATGTGRPRLAGRLTRQGSNLQQRRSVF